MQQNSGWKMNNRKDKVDILNRQEFIDRVVQIVNLISANKGNMTFAIDGAWGCGKTFVLEEIEKRLSEDASKKYLVIPYNCWQYDYYDEPLVALVAALNDFADSTKLIPEDAKTEIKHIFGKVGLKLFSQIIKNKIGVDAEELITTAKEAYVAASDAVQSQHEFDSFYGFKQVLAALHEELKKLTEKYTLVLAVDELDRCLPEYAIKVLERLHHVTDDLPNTICIISIDKKRLSNTINSIFGNNSADDYLKKFIRFTIELDTGKQNGQAFFDKFPEFYNRFDGSLYGELNRIDQFVQEIFQGISVREQEQIVEKAAVFSDICFGETKQDFSMMCMVLFLAVLHYHYHVDCIFSERNRPTDFENLFSGCRNVPNAFHSKSSGFVFKNVRVQLGFGKHFQIDSSNIYEVVFFYWYHIGVYKNNVLQERDIFPQRSQEDERIEDNLNVLRTKLDLLKIIA